VRAIRGIHVATVIIGTVLLSGCGSDGPDATPSSTTAAAATSSADPSATPTASTTTTTTTTTTTLPMDPLGDFVTAVAACAERPVETSPIDLQESWAHQFIEVSTSCVIDHDDPNHALRTDTAWLRVFGTSADTVINDAVESAAVSITSIFHADAVAVATDHAAGGPGTAHTPELSFSMSVVFDTPDLIGLRTTVGGYYSGRPSLEYWTGQRTFDAADGHDIHVDDLFLHGWLDPVIAMVGPALVDQYPNAEPGDRPLTLDDFGLFVPRADGLAFTFNGRFYGLDDDPTVTLPWADLGSLVDPDGPVGAHVVVDPPDLDDFTAEIAACRGADPIIEPLEHRAGWTHSFTVATLACDHPNDYAGIEFSAQWPRISGTPTDDTINATLQAHIDAEIDRYLLWAIETTQYNLDYDTPAGSASYSRWGVDITLDQPDLVSMVVHDWSYYAGAANGNEAARSFTFDTADGHLIVIDDLFLADSDWVTVLGEASHAILDASVDGISDLESWLRWPSPLVFEDFALALGGVQVNFDEYAVAPGYLGGLSALVPWDQLADVIDPDGPVGRFLPDA